MNQAKKGKNGSLTSVFQQTEFTLGIIIVALFIVASVGTDNFCTVYNITNLMKQCAIIGVLAVAQTMVIITGGIDISCGAITGLSCMVLALLQRDTNVNFYLTLVIAVVVSVLCGLINGIIVHEFRVPAMIATLGTQTIIYGIVKIISGALTVSGLDQRLLDMGNTNIGGLFPVLAIFWIIVSVVIFLVYAFAGLLYGIAGIMLAARVQSALPTGGEGYEMNAIAAAVIGGASLTGGRGAVAGTILGTILMTLINNAGVQFGLNTHVLEITSGVLIIFAVTMDMLKARKKG